jgi:AcrR family transcriptional regulator
MSMPPLRAYRRTDPAATDATRERIVQAVRDLLEGGTFHEASVEEVAKRAGVARATVYQHFGSRLGLVDAVCDRFDENPALVELRDTVVLEDPDGALRETIALTMRFWDSEEPILRHLYGLASIDSLAAELVERQFRDRRFEMERLIANVSERGALAPELSRRDALRLLLVLTSFETYEQLHRHEGVSSRQATSLIQKQAARMLLAPG